MTKSMADMNFSDYERSKKTRARSKAKGAAHHFSIEKLDDGSFKSHTSHEMKAGSAKEAMMLGPSMVKTASHPTIQDAADHMIAAFSSDRAVGKKPKSNSPGAAKASQANGADDGD
jgi:hypothetical protein